MISGNYLPVGRRRGGRFPPKGASIYWLFVRGLCAPEKAHAIVEEELALRYLRAVIRRVISIETEKRMSYWKVETDRGLCEFLVTSLSENVRRTSPEHLVIPDAFENRFEIVNIRQLDQCSRKILDRVL